MSDPSSDMEQTRFRNCVCFHLYPPAINTADHNSEEVNTFPSMQLSGIALMGWSTCSPVAIFKLMDGYLLVSPDEEISPLFTGFGTYLVLMLVLMLRLVVY